MTRTTPSRWQWHILPTALLAFMIASPVFALTPTPTTTSNSSHTPPSRETQQPSSPNDLFRALSLQVPKRPDPPICCLKKKEDPEGVGDDEDLLLLSFEEWKVKQQQALAQLQLQQHLQTQDSHQQRRDGTATGLGSSGSGGHNVGVGGNGSGAVNGHNLGGTGSGGIVGHGTGGPSDGNDSSAPEGVNLPPDLSASPNENGAATANVPIGTPDDNTQPPHYESLSPHFRVPLTDRFNYASLDCSARVHTAHKSAKSPSNILASKKDRYMLSPCRGRAKKNQIQYVVVELCEDIRIDTVQLANFEFFSGVFKDFSVSVAKTYTTDSEGWVPAGTYRAKNVRGVQSFHPPVSLRDFYRYIRIDFQSHYGTEYYCPISLLRVYGLTHLEEYKWDMWESESRAKLIELANAPIPDPVPFFPPNEAVEGSSYQEDREPSQPSTGGGNVLAATHGGEPVPPKPSYEDPTVLTVRLPDTQSAPPPTAEPPSPISASTGKDVVESSNSGTNNVHIVPRKSAGIASGIRDLIVSSTSLSSKHGIPTSSQVKTKEGTSTVAVTTVAPTSSKAASTSASSHQPAISPSTGGQHAHSHGHNNNHVHGHPHQNLHGQAASTHAPLAVPINSPLVPPLPTAGGESIYKIIMNRLTALEMNHTLYVRYIEQQTNGMKEVLKRLKEDIGRVEAIGRAQGQTLQKSMREWERQNYEIQREYGELKSKVDYLRDEIILEKRLSIAQLCLLLTVLVFMGLTRGSRGGDSIPQQPIIEPVEGHGQGKRIHRSGGKRRVRNISYSGSDWGRLVAGLGTGTEGKPKAKRNVRVAPLSFGDAVKFEFPRAGDTEDEAPESPLDGNIINLSHEYDRPHSQLASQKLAQAQPRSDTPSTRSPTSRHFPFQRPVTPTSSAFPRMHLQRSNSLHSSGPGSGVVVQTLPTGSSGAGGSVIPVGHGTQTPASTVVMLNTPAWSSGGSAVGVNTSGGAASVLGRSVLIRRGGAAYSAHLHELRRGKGRRTVRLSTGAGGAGTSPVGRSNSIKSGGQEGAEELFGDYYGSGAGHDTPTKKRVKGKNTTTTLITTTATASTGAASRGRTTGARGNGSDAENEDVFLYTTSAGSSSVRSSPSRSTSRSRGRGGGKFVNPKMGRMLKEHHQNSGLVWGVGTPVSETKMKKSSGGPGEVEDLGPVLGVVGRGIGRVNDDGGVHVALDVIDPDVDADADNWTTEGSAD
ncbi:hypothetical protein BDN72DRAFT_838760 [Pluteus cervinus]|uniref:Uncharacterized protein n=1 Tax=Pluteus cervinus TaxID=181527 RepID=A0ACD3AX22_9AGAR|nr:hypothetical protein BDN72DRAFT_838760 [Pluteus cervinus]